MEELRTSNHPRAGFALVEPECPDLGPETGLLLPPAREFLVQLLGLRLLSVAAARRFLEQHAGQPSPYEDGHDLGRALGQAGLVTAYQLRRLRTGATHGLVLGNYRVLDRLGAGAMAVVYRAEHYLMKRHVAVKAMPVDEDCSPDLLERFAGEIRVLADLHHPNIVTAYDAGELPAPGPQMPGLLYLVMELVSGGDLEQHVIKNGPASVGQACDWIRQAACGLQEAHDRKLIHRDIKPSNLLLTTQGQVKVVDFGLVRQFSSRLTNPKVLLGTIEFMAPEQSNDPTRVGIQADIYGLGASLFWVLTGQPPHPTAPTLAAALTALQDEPARRLRDLRPDIPEELDHLVSRMLDRDPGRRPSRAAAVKNALLRFAVPAVSF
ncbi:MAG: serine/threonine protein kinase [Planctomycetes bacterium]|nr:serine/threonine protein kinase [Planctomycetota bacterium]